MADSVKKVLFVNSEMVPYLPESPVGNLCRQLPQGIQERKKEIRAFMPKYGCINERKNQLHLPAAPAGHPGTQEGNPRLHAQVRLHQ